MVVVVVSVVFFEKKFWFFFGFVGGMCMAAGRLGIIRCLVVEWSCGELEA